MTAATRRHVVHRADGVGQVEREDVLLRLSAHDRRADAIDTALVIAKRGRCSLAIHRRPRAASRWIDLAGWALLGRDLDTHRRRAA